MKVKNPSCFPPVEGGVPPARMRYSFSLRTTREPVGFHPDTKQPIYLLTGPFAEFHGLIHRHHLALEHELAKDDPEALFPVDEYALGDSAD